MHRHGYKGRKLSRKRDPRRLLIKNQATMLIDFGYLSTTLPKAKEVIPYVEKLITKAKKGDLHNRRLIISKLSNVAVAHKLVDFIAPQLKDRQSGYLQIEDKWYRRGDNACIVNVVFTDSVNFNIAESADKSEQDTAEKTQEVSNEVK